MPEVSLQRPGVVPLVRESIAAGVPQHVRMSLEAQLGLDPQHTGVPLHHPIIT
jgi:hypothetical protein